MPGVTPWLCHSLPQSVWNLLLELWKGEDNTYIIGWGLMNREGSVTQARECSVSIDTHFLVVGSIMPVYIYRSTKLGSYNIYSVVFFFLYNWHNLGYALFIQAFLHPQGLATGTLAMPGRFAELVVRASPAPALKLPMAPCCHQSKSHPLSDVWVLSCLFLSTFSTLPLRVSQAILPRIPAFLLQSSIRSLSTGALILAIWSQWLAPPPSRSHFPEDCVHQIPETFIYCSMLNFVYIACL